MSPSGGRGKMGRAECDAAHQSIWPSVLTVWEEGCGLSQPGARGGESYGSIGQVLVVGWATAHTGQAPEDSGWSQYQLGGVPAAARGVPRALNRRDAYVRVTAAP